MQYIMVPTMHFSHNDHSISLSSILSEEFLLADAQVLYGMDYNIYKN